MECQTGSRMQIDCAAYKVWLVNELTNHTHAISEAHALATEFMKTPRYQESYERWEKLMLDIMLALNPVEEIKFPMV